LETLRKFLEKSGSSLVPFLFVFSLSFFILLFRVVYSDMFFDGVIYAGIGRNMAEGVGSFWAPFYTFGFLNPFYEHPPLVFYLQSWAYRFLGENPRIEYLWGLCQGFLVFFITIKTFSLTDRNKLKTAWFPVLLLVTTPTISWTFNNNMLESTMTVFTSLSVYFFCRAFFINKNVFFWGLLSGACMFFGFLCKGPTALFPLALPVLFLFIYGKFPKKESFGLIVAIALSTTFVFLVDFSAATSFFSNYFYGQIIKSVTGKNEEVRYLYLFFRFLGEVVVPLAVSLLLWFFFKPKTKEQKRTVDRDPFFWLMLLIALCASVPTFFSPKQRVWYVFASWPFYCIALAHLFNGAAVEANEFFKKKTPKSILLFTSVTLFLFAGYFALSAGTKGFKRVPDFYTDLISQNLPIEKKQSTARVCPDSLNTNWEILAFAQRHFRLSFSSSRSPYYFIDNQSGECDLSPPGCTQLNQNPKRFYLYRCGVE